MTMRGFALCALVPLLAACLKPDLNALRIRAAFDLKCEEQALTLQQLKSTNADKGTGAVYGVRGCGRQATYINMHANDEWLLDHQTQ